MSSTSNQGYLAKENQKQGLSKALPVFNDGYSEPKQPNIESPPETRLPNKKVSVSPPSKACYSDSYELESIKDHLISTQRSLLKVS